MLGFARRHGTEALGIDLPTAKPLLVSANAADEPESVSTPIEVFCNSLCTCR